MLEKNREKKNEQGALRAYIFAAQSPDAMHCFRMKPDTEKKRTPL